MQVIFTHVSVMQKNILVYKYTQAMHFIQMLNRSYTIPSWGDDFSSCNPKCLVCKSALPIGTALLKRVSCNDTWLKHGLE